jgi:hypothetical protein
MTEPSSTAAYKAPLALDELATLAARVVAHMPYATALGRDSEQAYFDAKALRDALDLIDPEVVRKNMLAPGQPRPHWADDKGCPR